jgi:ferredoxin
VKVIVNSQTCEHHGQCEIVCPDVFTLVSAERLEYVGEPHESLREDVEAAVDACPTISITIED